MDREPDAVLPRLRAMSVAICIVLSPSVHSDAITVGDIQVDPRDFAAGQDPRTRIAPCLLCHGEHAGGDIDFGPDAHYGTPALRGMDYEYLKQSLIDYKAGKRRHEEMEVISSMLDEEAIDFMARKFAAYPVPRPETADEIAWLAATEPRFRKGQAIARQGVPEKGVPGCSNCHGASGEGIANIGPRLAGQNSIYVQQQLAAYAANARHTAQAAVMHPIVAGLSGDEIEAVAYYYQQLINPDEP